MNRALFIPSCILILFLSGNAMMAPSGPTAPASVRAEAETPEIDANPAPETGTDAQTYTEPAATSAISLDVGARIRKNLLTDMQTLQLVSMRSAIFLYPEPTTKSTKTKLVNRAVQGVSELIVLAEVTSPEGAVFYQVRSIFSNDTGYVLARDTRESRLAATGVTGYARIEAAACYLLEKPAEKANVLAKEWEHMVRILGMLDGYYYVITEAGNFGYVLPAQVVRITDAEMESHLARAESPAVRESMNDPLTKASAANAARMLRAGTDSAAVRYWTTAQAHVPQQGWLKKAAIAMLTVATGGGPAPVGYDGIQFQHCPEVPIIADGMQLQQGLDFNLHGSIYTNSPLTSASASLVPLSGEGAAIRETVNFLPEQSITGYSISSGVEPIGGVSLDRRFDISRLRAGQYRFTLQATTLAQPDPVTLVDQTCEIVVVKKFILTENKFGDNYSDALEFFGGNTEAFLFPYSLKDGRSIATDETWRTAHIVVSSIGRVHIDAVPNFETANHYLQNTYLRVSLYNHYKEMEIEGSTILLADLVEKSTTYVPRFMSNLEYLSHHTLGTAIDINDHMYPNKNIPRNHYLIGWDVRNHLTYRGIKTDEAGRQYYDFAYNGTYPARVNKVPKTIINYLIYELAFYRAGFEWGFYYESTCDAMHFMLTENDINRHMHSDIGLRKVYAYIEPEWTYVAAPSSMETASLTPIPTR